MLALVSTSMLLAACGKHASLEPPKANLPGVPADIRACFQGGAPEIPERALTVADVERLLKQDGVRIAVLQRCGKRFLAWYDTLKAEWR